MQFLPQHPHGWNYTLSRCGVRERKRKAGFGLTIAAWTDINLFKLMEVSILLFCGGMSSIPGYSSNFSSSTSGPRSNNSNSIQMILTLHHAFEFLLSSCCIPVGHVTYTHAWHLVMSLHGRWVTQHPDSPRKITFVLGREKLPLPEVLYFLLCILLSVGDFSCGQHGCSVPTACPYADLLAGKQPALYFSTSLSLFLVSFSLALFFLTLYPIPSVSFPASTLHLCRPIPLSPSPSPPVRGLMWDCKWGSLTSISGSQRSICVAHYQPEHSLPLWRSHKGDRASKWSALNSSHVNMACKPP